MKKLTLLFIFSFVSLLNYSYAQFGVKLGANFGASGSYGNSEEGESIALKVGFQGGVYYMHNINEKIGLLAELNYEAKGTISKKDYTIQLPVPNPVDGSLLGIGDYAVNQEINSLQGYINLPVLVYFKLDKIKLYAGPNFGFLLSGDADFNRNIDISLGGNALTSTELEINGIDWKDYDSFKQIFTEPIPSEDGNFLNAFEMGINVGAMYNITEKVFLDLRVSQGLTDVTNNHYDNSIYPSEDFSFASRDDTDRNLSIQLSVGIAIK